MRTRTCITTALACVAFVSLATIGPWQAIAQPAANPLLDVIITSSPPLDEVDDLQPGQNPIDFFDAYSWKIFVALNWPNATGQRGVPDTSKSIDDGTTPRVWETWKAVEETFLPGGTPPAAWISPEAPSLCRNAAALGAAPTKLLADLNQGDDNGGSVGPLIAQNRTYVRYEIRFNKLEFDSIADRKLFIRSNISPATSRLPDGVIDIKAAWRELKPGESAARYYKTEALAMDPITGNCDVRSFVMIGFHIGQKTPKRPQWIWSTFEHVDNLTVGPEAPMGTKPSLNEPSKPQTLGDQPDPIDATHPPKADPDPVQVVLESPLNRIPPETAATNAKWHADPKIKGSFLRFYQLVRTQWPTLVPPNPVGSGSPFPSQRVANMTMETYLQASSCIGCHVKTTLNTDFVWAINNRAFPIKNNLLSNAKVLNDQAKKPAP